MRVLTILAAFLVCMSLGSVASVAAESNASAACEYGQVGYIYLNGVLFGGSCPPGFNYQCVLEFYSFPLMFVYVQVKAVPFQKIRFTLPDPPQGSILFEQWSYPYTGDRVNGVEMDLGACTPGEDVCLGFIAVSAAPTGCPLWYVTPGTAEIQDCDGAWQDAYSVPSSMGCDNLNYCFQLCPGVRPYGLYPPDGAASVPLDVELTWVEGEIYSYCNVRIGTDPACEGARDVFTLDCGTQSFSPSFLQPATTYYWQVFNAFDACQGGGLSPLHSFTTEGPVSATPTTWGRVKVMYSD